MELRQPGPRNYELRHRGVRLPICDASKTVAGDTLRVMFPNDKLDSPCLWLIKRTPWLVLALAGFLLFAWLCFRHPPLRETVETGPSTESNPVTLDSPQALATNELPNVLRYLTNEMQRPNVGKVPEGKLREAENAQDETQIQDELQKVKGKRLETLHLENTGSATILNLLETYYWSLREGDFKVFLQCHSPQEQSDWEKMGRAWGEANIAEQFKAAVGSTKDFEVIETTLELDRRCVIKLEYSMMDGKKGYELLSVSKSGGEWTVCGQRGQLKYGHLPSALGFRFK